MAMKTEASSPPPCARSQYVADAFTRQYYSVLFTNPDIGHKFYGDSSVLSWPGPDGSLTTVTTMQGIRDTISSFDCKSYTTEIESVEAQDSFKEGVLVFVKGCLIGTGNVKRSFIQTFFLVPQAKGYYVLNDIFRFVNIHEPVRTSDDKENVTSSPSTPNQESGDAPIPPEDGKSLAGKVTNKNRKAKGSNSSDAEVSNITKDVIASKEPLGSHEKDGNTNAEVLANVRVSYASIVKDKVKMSYASIVARESRVTSLPQTSPRTVAAIASVNSQQRVAQAPKSSNLHGKYAPQSEAIYVGNLPSNVSAKQVHTIFKVFGPIKKEGVHIKICEDGFCYAFVDFESLESAHAAIQARSMRIGSKESCIAERRAGRGRGRVASEKGELHNEDNRTSPGGPTRRSGEAYGRGYQNVATRGGSSSGGKFTR
ncbi:nuclear transport factor 2-like [Diospyros lotus]|uniref:nuclear transport factor 2-like n=1 Tax=Diospyros lotus TaxID=55363 RepID=UPI0022541226|nr:nuclear transport factor 2-like [Diospyros lotus]